MPAVSHDVLTRIPEQIVAGTQVDYRRTFSDVAPGSGWALKLYLSGGDPAAPVSFSKDFTVEGQSFTISLLATDTVTLTRGNYQWEERGTKATEKVRADYGTISILPDIATATATSLLSRTARELAAVRAAIDIRMGIGGTATDFIEKYGIGSRNIEKLPLEKLLSLESRLAMAVKREANPGQWGPQVKVRFPSVSGERWPTASE